MYHQFLDSANLPPVDYHSLDGMRALSDAADAQTLAALGPTPPDIKRTELKYSTRDGTEVRAVLYQPVSPPSNGSPLVVMFHGGGFCVGTPEGEEQTCRNLVRAFNATCISAQYRLAPEYKFPCGVKDAWDCLKWAAANAKTWGADPSTGFVVGGTSAGANISAVLAHVARDENLSPPLTGQYLAVPKVLPFTRVPEKYKEYHLSAEQNKDAPVLPMAAIDTFDKAFEPDNDDAVWYATFNHEKGHGNLPMTLLQIDGMDPLRDEGIIYERVLREEYGIKTKMYVYPGLPHASWLVFPSLKSTQKFRADQVEGFGWLLSREPDLSNVNK
jgi:acetyl esterase/lipase